MSFSYDISLGATRDKLRLLIDDRDGSNIIYENEELDGILGEEANLYRAAALALRGRAASFVAKTISYTIGGETRGVLSIDRKKIYEAILTLAQSYEDRALSTPVEYFDRAEFDVDSIGNNNSNYQGFNDTDLDF